MNMDLPVHQFVLDSLNEERAAAKTMTLTRVKDMFTGLDTVKEFFTNGVLTAEKHSQFERSIAGKPQYMQEVLRHTLIKEMGNQNFIRRYYREAIGEYIRAAKFLLRYNGDVNLPSFDDVEPGMYDKICRGQGYAELFYLLTLASCYNNIALCCIKLGNRIEAIDWIQEVTKMYSVREDLNRVDGYLIFLAYQYFIKSQMRLTEVFLALGNTGSAAYSSFLCSNFGTDGSVRYEAAELQKLRDQSKMVDMASARHPSFIGAADAAIVDAELQMRGAWRKLHARRGVCPRSRAGFASWIWRGALYVSGGLEHCRRPKRLLDIWCLDLKHMNSWRHLPDIPRIFYLNLNFSTDTKMRVWENEAWLFAGSKVVIKFNMLKEQWLRVTTKWTSTEPWPYAKNIANEYCAEIFEGQLHIFGGGDSLESTGINLHMRLDLKTLVWTKLGGTVKPRERNVGPPMPTLHKACGSWVVPRERRMYVLYGYASILPKPANDKLRSDHQHGDIWSYSFSENKWRPERLRGNFPAPRAKMACAYHPGLDRVLLFGGCNVRLLLFDGEHTRILFNQTHFGDTFALDMQTRVWKQVLTRNFPHHRADAQINVDVESGKIYLYGGSCSSRFMPLKNADEKSKTVSLGDLWQLDLDLPGQDFDASQFETKALIRGFGPWKLCFACKEYKADIKKCAGTCAGRIYLCSVECQKQCWSEHKRLHRCSKF